MGETVLSAFDDVDFLSCLFVVGEIVPSLCCGKSQRSRFEISDPGPEVQDVARAALSSFQSRALGDRKKGALMGNQWFCTMF